jgi:hypothetical protein
MSLADELAKLEALRRSGALTEAEFAKAKAAILHTPSATPAETTLGQHMADIKQEHELARIDREWEIERQQYLIVDRFGRRQIPTASMGIGMAVIGGVGGVLWTMFASSFTAGFPDEGPFGGAKSFFPAFGILFIVAAVGFGLHCFYRANRYQRAYLAYQARRAAALNNITP